MKQACSWPTAEEWRNPMEQPWRVDRESGQQRENEKNRDRPVQETRINRMTQQLAATHTRSTEPGKLATSFFVEGFRRHAHGFSFRPASISSAGVVRTS